MIPIKDKYKNFCMDVPVLMDQQELTTVPWCSLGDLLGAMNGNDK